MTPQGHMFAGWITFSATERGRRDGRPGAGADAGVRPDLRAGADAGRPPAGGQVLEAHAAQRWPRHFGVHRRRGRHGGRLRGQAAASGRGGPTCGTRRRSARRSTRSTRPSAPWRRRFAARVPSRWLTAGPRRRRRRRRARTGWRGDHAGARPAARCTVLEAARRRRRRQRTAELTLPGFVHDVCSAIHPLALASPVPRDAAAGRARPGAGAPRGAAGPPARRRHRRAAASARSSETADALGADGRPAYRRLIGAAGRATPTTLMRRAARAAAAARATRSRWRASGWPALRSARRARPAPASTASGARALLAGLRGPLDAAARPGRRRPPSALMLMTARRTPSAGRLRAAARSDRRRDGVATCASWAARSSPGTGRVASTSCAAPARCCSTSRRGSSSRSPGTGCPAATAGALRSLPLRPRRLQGRLGAGRPDPVAAPRVRDGPAPCTSAARSTRSRASEDDVATGASPSGRSCCSPSRRCSTRPGRPRASTRVGLLPRPDGLRRRHDRRIEAQIERFAPGFRDRVLARHAMGRPQMEATTPTTSAATSTAACRTSASCSPGRWSGCDPYTTPDPRPVHLLLSTPPGGGVHGMCGYYAARAALRRLG